MVGVHESDLARGEFGRVGLGCGGASAEAVVAQFRQHQCGFGWRLPRGGIHGEEDRAFLGLDAAAEEETNQTKQAPLHHRLKTSPQAEMSPRKATVSGVAIGICCVGGATTRGGELPPSIFTGSPCFAKVSEMPWDSRAKKKLGELETGELETGELESWGAGKLGN